MSVLITGGTGTTGRLLAELLRAKGTRVHVATRKPSAADHVRFEWADPATHGSALSDVDRIYLVVPPIGMADPNPLTEPFLATAVAAGVRRVVLLSSSAIPESDRPGLGRLHRLVRTMSPEWTVLRPSWFQQNFTGEHTLAGGILRDGEIVSATGDGRIAFVDAADIAAVAARALLDETPHNTEHLITGPEAVSYAEAAAIITKLTGLPVRHRNISTGALAERFTASGVPAQFAVVLAALEEDIRNGSEDRVTDVVPRITGRPARGFTEFIAAHRAVFSRPVFS